MVIAIGLLSLSAVNAQPNSGVCPVWKIESVTDVGGGKEVVLYECAACCGSSRVYYIAEVRQIASIQGFNQSSPILYASLNTQRVFNAESMIASKMSKSRQIVFSEMPNHGELENIADADCEVDPKAFYKSDPDQGFWDWLWNGTRYVDGYGNTTYDVATAAAGGLC